MWLLAKRTAVVLSTALLFAVVSAFIYASRWVLTIFLFAIFVADLLHPLVSHLYHWKKLSRGSRTIAILEVYAMLGVVTVLLVLLVGPRIGNEVQRLGATLPALLEKVNSGQIARQLGAKHGWSYETQLHLQNVISLHRRGVLSVEDRIGEYLAALAQNAIWFVLIPILAFFFLKDGRAFADELAAMVKQRRPQRFLQGILEDLNEMVAHYVRAQLALTGLALVFYMLVFWLMRLPYSFALSSIAGILEFIPIVGPATAAVVVLGVCFLETYSHLFAVVLVLGAWRVVQDYLITPHIMKSNLKMHPLAAIFAVLVGGEVGGVVGVYLSIPIMAGLRILWTSWKQYSEVQPAARRP
jgi:predicted PurR-regulated permease PerM